jgi:hypothetical protein
MSIEMLVSEKGRLLTRAEIETLWHLNDTYFAEMNAYHRLRDKWMSDPNRDMNAFPESPPFYTANLFYITETMRMNNSWEGDVHHVEHVMQYRLDVSALDLYPTVVTWMREHGVELSA